MIPIPALILCIIFAVLAGFHLYWAFSGSHDESGVVPTSDGSSVLHPGKAVTLLVATLLAAAAVVALWRGAWPGAGPSWIPGIGIWVIAAAFAARAIGDFRYAGFSKTVRGTAFARSDTLFFSPLCFSISMLAVWLALIY